MRQFGHVQSGATPTVAFPIGTAGSVLKLLLFVVFGVAIKIISERMVFFAEDRAGGFLGDLIFHQKRVSPAFATTGSSGSSQYSSGRPSDSLFGSRDVNWRDPSPFTRN